jgi:hypothetical protein
MESFIPLGLAVAPNPLGLVSNLKLSTIPIDAYTGFELWTPTSADATLLPEEAMLLTSDRCRLQDICAKLVWLFGAAFVDQDTEFYQPLFYDWQDIEILIQQCDRTFNAINVNHLPQILYPSVNSNNRLGGWTLCPASWRISFLELHPVEAGYRVNPWSRTLMITLGQAMTTLVKHNVPRPTTPSAIAPIH